MTAAVLVFPGGMAGALQFLEQALASGRRVVGASSLAYDPARAKYPDWVQLPFVTDPDFGQRLLEAITRFGIDAIYTPNLVAWDHLNRILPVLAPGVRLLGDPPLDVLLKDYRVAQSQARGLLEDGFSLGSMEQTRPQLPEIELAALYRHANTIPGMCDDDKLRALIEVFRHSPAGDIVEIGSWWGKSAYILAHLAQAHGVGALLCVDPWSDAHLVQGESLVDRSSAQVSAQDAFEIFQMNLRPYLGLGLNYIRATSIEAARQYTPGLVIDTPGFGKTQCQGRISVLHIDGNHSFAAVQADVVAWAGKVVAGGWVVLDDYVWPYGDGPKRVGDALLAAEAANIGLSFVMGSALFLQVSQPLGV